METQKEFDFWESVKKIDTTPTVKNVIYIDEFDYEDINLSGLTKTYHSKLNLENRYEKE